MPTQPPEDPASRVGDGPPVRRVRREALVDAAERVFARRGFHAATVPEIAAAAAVSVGLLYRYFPGKAALAVAIVERERDRSRAGIAELIALVPDPRQALGYLVHEWIEIALADRAGCALVAEIAAEATRDEAVGAVVRAAEADVIDRVAGLVAGAFPDRDPTALAVLLVSALDGLVIRISCDPAFDPRPATAALIDLLDLPSPEESAP